jgi:hypothetical protein
LSVDGVQVAEDPVPRLQQKASLDTRLDGMLFLPAVYSGDATLFFPVLLVAPERETHVAQATKFIESIARDHPCFRPDSSAKPWELLHRPAGPPLQPALQQRLALSAGFKELRQVRVDRAHFFYADLDIKRLQVRCDGVRLVPKEFLPDEPPPARPELFEKVRKESSDLWGGIRMEANLDGIKPIPQPGPALQPRIAKQLALDGTRLYRDSDPRPYEGEFDQKGQLILSGQWRTPGQEKLLRSLLTQFFEVRPPRLDQNGIVLRMDVFRTDLVLLDLKRYAADRLEDVLLQRLYFDDKGKMQLQGFIANEKDADELRKYLEERLTRLPISDARRRGVLVASARILPAIHGQVPRPPEDPGLELTRRMGLTAYLRSQLQASNKIDDPPKEERWDGVLLTRGFYTTDGDYVLRGLLGDVAQRSHLDVLLQQLSSTEWRAHLPNGWSLEGLRLMSMVEMLDRLRVVMPAYADFDGVTLQRGFHDQQGRLILRVGVVNVLPRDAEVTFKKLLDAHPEWKARSAAGVRVQVTGPPLTQDLRVVEESILKAVQELKFLRIEPAIQLTTTAILHEPEDSTAWYLRALCYLLRGDTEQADRDLRRTVQLEREGVRYPGPRAALRLERLELLQSKYRQMLNERRKRVLSEVEAGKPPLTLPRTP